MNTSEQSLLHGNSRIAHFGLSALSLLIANAVLLVLYFVYGLSLYALVLVYWCECLWIGVYSALKLIVASIIGDPYENRWANVSRGGALFLTVLIIGFSSSLFFSLLGFSLMAILWVGDALPQAGGNGDLLGVALGTSLLFLASHGLSFLVNFLIRGEFRQARVGMLVIAPFARSLALLVMTLAAILALGLMPELASTGFFAAIVMCAKVAWDYWLHRRERARFEA